MMSEDRVDKRQYLILVFLNQKNTLTLTHTEAAPVVSNWSVKNNATAAILSYLLRLISHNDHNNSQFVINGGGAGAPSLKWKGMCSP